MYHFLKFFYLIQREIEVIQNIKKIFAKSRNLSVAKNH